MTEDEIPPDLYAEPRIRPQHKRYPWLERQCQFFHEHHRVDRWNLMDPLDAFQLYYTIDILGFRSFELAMLLSRDRQYAKSHYYHGVYDASNHVLGTIFPYKTEGTFDIEEWYQRVQRETREIEEKLYGEDV
jgi:hypothetical protein